MAQQPNDDCDGVIALGQIPYCDGNQIYSNTSTTATDVIFDNEPFCFVENPPMHDVWFTFQVDEEMVDFEVTITGIGVDPLTNIQAAVYRGSCAINSMAVRNCGTSEINASELTIQVADATPKEILILRIDNFGSNDDAGEFTICIQPKSEVQTIADSGSTACNGILTDSGGESDDYGPNENYLFTICPNTPFSCLSFELEYYNIEESQSGGDALIIFDGLGTTGNILSIIGPQSGSGGLSGGGGVCLRITNDACMTVQFISDGSVEFEGFKARWSCTLQNCAEIETIQIVQDVSEEDIRNIISTDFADVKIDKISCPQGAFATFKANDRSDLGLSKGLLLTTGSPLNTIGPNIDVGRSTEHFAKGDEDLDILSKLYGNGTTSNDACIIELDLFAVTNELNFEYIFGSEEYPEFVHSDFNDIFALLISGPGIDGIPEIGNQQNLAILPDSDVFVQINSVNNEDNWAYFRNNTNGESIEYDGLTSDFSGRKKSLTAKAEVIPCNTYHLKFAIADRGDSAFDSGVFISEISAGIPRFATNFEHEIDYLIEYCNTDQDFLFIGLKEALDDTIRYLVDITGTAINGEDYTLNIPDTLTFLPGETIKVFRITTLVDELEEGTETIIITLSNNTPCGKINLTSQTIHIRDRLAVDFEIESDTLFHCQGEAVNLSISGAENYHWSPEVYFTDATVSEATISIDTNRWIFVEGSLDAIASENCKIRDSIYVQSINPELTIKPLSPTNICVGDSIQLNADYTPDGQLQWSTPNGQFSHPHQPSTWLYPTSSASGQRVIASLTVGQCHIQESITFNTESLVIPSFIIGDTTICQGSSLQLASGVLNNPTTYRWTPSNYLSRTDIANPIASPKENITYSLSMTSGNAYCQLDTSIHIDVIKTEINILEGDTLATCLGDSLLLRATSISEEEIVDIAWSGTPQIIESSDMQAQILADKAGYIQVSQSSGSCTSRDSIFIRVDSLPDLSIIPLIDKTAFCKGEIISLGSSNFSQVQFPDIQFDWLDNGSIVTARDGLNTGIKADSSQWYFRYSQNGKCSSLDSFYLSVVMIDTDIQASDTILCPNESLTLNVISNQNIDSVVWSITPTSNNANASQASFSLEENEIITAEIFSNSCKIQDTISIMIYELPEVILGVDPEVVALGTEVLIDILLSTNTWDIDNVNWLINGNPAIQNDNPLEFTVKDSLTLVEAEILLNNGCKISNNTLISAKVPQLLFPDVILPNSNVEVNRFFTFTALIDNKVMESPNLEVKQFKIYNRWGQEVFKCEALDCALIGWDAMHSGEAAPAEVYVYVFEGLLPNGKSIFFKGNFTLLR